VWMMEAWRQTRKDGAAGVDGQTASDYRQNLRANLESLLDRAKKGDPYRAPPVRRVYIPKTDGRMRPLGIPTLEDKILQRAVVMLLEPVYEQEFYEGSYGFRPGRSAHDALEALREELMEMGGGWVLEADIKSFFDMVDHTLLQEIVRKRVSDGVITRLIGKWLRAGVMEEGKLHRPEAGTPQGGVISPLLANIYLHEVLDQWFEREVKPRLAGHAALIRYADDFVIVFEQEEDARRVNDVLPRRFERYGLALHPEKTRLIRFERPPRGSNPRREREQGRRPETFDLLGFTHYWAKSLKGNWVILRKTSQKRIRRTLEAFEDWARGARHLPPVEQHRQLSQKLKGHYQYFGLQGNSRSLWAVLEGAKRIWRKWLSRRSQQRAMTWERFARWLKRFPLPQPRIGPRLKLLQMSLC
jgi:RNA-directed DNA polymerase